MLVAAARIQTEHVESGRRGARHKRHRQVDGIECRDRLARERAPGTVNHVCSEFQDMPVHCSRREMRAPIAGLRLGQLIQRRRALRERRLAGPPPAATPARHWIRSGGSSAPEVQPLSRLKPSFMRLHCQPSRCKVRRRGFASTSNRLCAGLGRGKQRTGRSQESPPTFPVAVAGIAPVSACRVRGRTAGRRGGGSRTPLF